MKISDKEKRFRERAARKGYRVNRRGEKYRLSSKDGAVMGGTLDGLTAHFDALEAELRDWLAEHPGRKARDFDLRKPEILAWRKARAKAADDAMRAAFRRDHPGRFSDKAARAGIWRGPLPEHLCQFDHPYPGYEKVAANVIAWLNNYERHRRRALAAAAPEVAMGMLSVR